MNPKKFASPYGIDPLFHASDELLITARIGGFTDGLGVPDEVAFGLVPKHLGVYFIFVMGCVGDDEVVRTTLFFIHPLCFDISASKIGVEVKGEYGRATYRITARNSRPADP